MLRTEGQEGRGVGADLQKGSLDRSGPGFAEIDDLDT
mgnify:CR=1 FL=1